MTQENRRLDCQPYSSGQMVKRLTDLSANLYLQVISTFSVSTEIRGAVVQQEGSLKYCMEHLCCCFDFHRVTLGCLGPLDHPC